MDTERHLITDRAEVGPIVSRVIMVTAAR